MERKYNKVKNRQRKVGKRLRTQQIRRRVFGGILTLSITLCLALSINNFTAKARNTNESQSYKYYTSISVDFGETLWGIAETYMDSHYDSLEDYIQEVMRINHLKDEHITSGQYIIVPYYSEEFL